MGLRAVVWFQGCTLGCPGCFNPETHATDGGWLEDTKSLARRMVALGDRIEGVTFSGGEPFQQPEALLDILEELSRNGDAGKPPLSTLLFSGYTLEEITRRPLGRDILTQLDVLVAGRYVLSRHAGKALLGSENQRVHFLTDRYTPSDVTGLPLCEILLHADGTVALSGISPWQPTMEA
jgi:anaerobic ribonucleoside-triphosphate reductase activating protein